MNRKELRSLKRRQYRASSRAYVLMVNPAPKGVPQNLSDEGQQFVKSLATQLQIPQRDMDAPLDNQTGALILSPQAIEELIEYNHALRSNDNATNQPKHFFIDVLVNPRDERVVITISPPSDAPSPIPDSMRPANTEAYLRAFTLSPDQGTCLSKRVKDAVRPVMGGVNWEGGAKGVSHNLVAKRFMPMR